MEVANAKAEAETAANVQAETKLKSALAEADRLQRIVQRIPRSELRDRLVPIARLLRTRSAQSRRNLRNTSKSPSLSH